MKHALILAPFDQRRLAELRRSVRVTYEPWLDTGLIHDPEVLARRLHAEDVAFLVIEGDFVFDDVMDAAPSLELVGVCRNALNHVDVDAATERGVLIVNVPGRNTVAVAELTVGLLLALSRRIPQADAYVKQGRWEDPVSGYRSFRGSELAGKTAGILGLGAIGREVARRVGAMDMRLLAHDPYVNPEQAAAIGVTLTGLDTVLAEADYLLVHVPAGDGTLGMIGERQLRSMRPTSALVNTSAAGVVDEAALARALKEGWIAAAALDVFEGQPLPGSSPLLRLDNVILTPHIGGATLETVERQSAMIAEDIALVLEGRRPVRLVNPDVWERRRR